MKLQPIKKERRRGIALIIVMMFVFALAAIAGGFAYSVKVETTLARNAQDDHEYEWLARSGMEYAKWILGQTMDLPTYNSDNERQFWSSGLTFGADDFFDGYSLSGNKLGRGEFSIEIEDLQSKFNINFADEEILIKANELIGIDSADAPVIVDSILDWIDQDDNPHINGVETDYYQSLDPPYLCKDGPIDDLSELLLVNGITEDMFNGISDALRNTAGMTRLQRFRLSQANIPDYTNSFVELFTTMGVSLVNANTATNIVLQVAGMDEYQAQLAVEYRAGLDGMHGTEDDNPFESLQELAMATQIPVAALTKRFAVNTPVFEVTITIDIGGRKRTKVARIYRRSPTDVHVMFSYWK